MEYYHLLWIVRHSHLKRKALLCDNFTRWMNKSKHSRQHSKLPKLPKNGILQDMVLINMFGRNVMFRISKMNSLCSFQKLTSSGSSACVGSVPKRGTICVLLSPSRWVDSPITFFFPNVSNTLKTKWLLLDLAILLVILTGKEKFSLAVHQRLKGC